MSTHDPNYVYKPSFFVVGTKTILLNDDKKILVIKRSTEGKGVNHNKWSLPGGALDENEDPVLGARREIKEELGIENVDNLRIFATNFHPRKERPLIVLGYKGNISNDEKIVLNWEHSECKFLTKEDALKLDLTEDGRYFIQNS